MGVNLSIEKEALQYEKHALEDGILKHEKNIKIFEEAISKEREEITKKLQMITILEIHGK